MNSCTVVYKGEVIPEKDLIKVITYKCYPTPEIKQQIIEDVKKNLNCDLEDYIVGIEISVDLKEYGKVEKFHYDKEIKNDTKNTGV